VCSCVAAASAQSVEQSLAQTLNQSAGPTAQSYQGSVTAGEATGPTIDLTLDDAIQRGLKNNLGVILSGTQTASTRGQRLSQLQSLLPSVDATTTGDVLAVAVISAKRTDPVPVFSAEMVAASASLKALRAEPAPLLDTLSVSVVTDEVRSVSPAPTSLPRSSRPPRRTPWRA